MILQKLFGKKRQHTTTVVIGYGDAMGIYDVWEFNRLKKRLSLNKCIAVVRSSPTEKVLREAEDMGIEVIIADDPRGMASHLKEKLEAEGYAVKVKKLEEIADRSIMSDPC